MVVNEVMVTTSHVYVNLLSCGPFGSTYRGPRKTHPFQTHPPSRTVSRCSVVLFTSSPPAGAGDATQGRTAIT